MSADEWSEAGHVRHYLEEMADFPERAAGEGVLLDQLPATTRRVLDLGTGDGRLLALVMAARPAARGIGLDRSAPMLAAARERLAGDSRIEVVEHDLTEPLPALGRFEAIVSAMAIHHLEHDRKRSLYGEVFELLEPGGVFANLEHVASASERLHLAFFAAIGEPLEWEDPSDRLLDVHSQLEMLRGAGFEDVDCHWKWLEIALLAGVRPRGEHRAGSSPEPVVRPAVAADWPAIWGFMREIVAAGETFSWDFDTSETTARGHWMHAPPGRTFVAVDAEGRVIGTAEMGPNRGGGGAHIATGGFMVDAERRGLGAGRALGRRVLEEARAEGYLGIQFNAVVETNKVAVELWRSLGFRVIGTVPRGFRHPRAGEVGLLVMYREL